MKSKSAKEIREESKKRFLENFDEKIQLKLLYFHTFLCPIAMAEAMVKEHIVEEYDSLELLILRLYDAGFHNVKELVSLSGMDERVIERVLYNEMMVYHHIDMETGNITDIGKQTLMENENNGTENVKIVNHVIYNTPRRLQIEAATGTVIPRYMEQNNIKYLKSILEEWSEGVVPRESVQYDEELRREINERLSEYKHMDIIEEGDTIISIETLHTTQIYYRWAYLVKFEGMKYPMVVMQGRKSIDKVNADTRENGLYGRQVVLPLAISKTDDEYLRNNKLCFDEVIVRNDEVFEYLNEKTSTFNFHIENDDIQLENENEIYEDERVMESEDTIEE